MSKHTLWRYVAAFLALNAGFAAIGLLFRHPAGAPGWWATWIVADVAALSAFAMAVAGRPLELTWDRVLAWVFICVNAGGVVALASVAIAAPRCDSGGAPEGCLGAGLLLVLVPITVVAADLALGAIWAAGRAVGRAIRAA
jgi:hypothetical protein